MRELPTGTVTFLFTDVEGPTRLLQEHGDACADLVAEHRRALRDAFANHGGVEVDTQGDAFFVAFGNADDALAAAAEARDALASGQPNEAAIHDDRVSDIRSRLGEQAFRAAWRDGAVLGLQKAIAFARRDEIAAGA